VAVYVFSVHVRGLDMDSEFQNVFLDRCGYEVLASSSGGLTSLDVEIDCSSSLGAVNRVKKDLGEIGVTVVRVDLDLVGVPEIADRTGSCGETVRVWTTGERRSRFPKPHTVSGQSRLWAWADVWVWLTDNRIKIDALYAGTPIPLDVAVMVNGQLGYKNFPLKRVKRKVFVPVARQ